ncbi:hypothetical protein D3C84_348900 [compost metagenome]
MARTHEITLIGLVSAMFLTNLILIALLVVYSSRVTNNDYKYEILKEDYTRRILQVERAHDMKVGRIQEQLNSIQFTMDRRFELIDDRRFLEQRK